MPTTRHYGATPAEWQWAAYNFGADLLPAVGTPDFQVSPKSALASHKSLAKTPSVRGRNGLAFGIKGWTAHQATPEAVHEWGQDPELNILLITRNVRAIDIDIADESAADMLEAYIAAQLGIDQPLVRYRDGTGKRTLLLRITPHNYISKRVVHTPKGAIEFLANGQQTALCGSHPDGSRFKIKGTEIPTVAIERMELLWEALRQCYDINAPKFVDPNEQAGEFIVRNAGTLRADPVLDYLIGEGLVVGFQSNGAAYVVCPNAEAHTSDTGPSSTCWLPAGLGGRDAGGFRCLHSHCGHIDTGLFKRLIGLDKKDAEAAFGESSIPAPVVAVESPLMADISRYRMAAAELEQQGIGFLRNEKGTALEPGPANINHICRGVPDFIRVRQDVFRDELLIQTGDATVWRVVDDNSITNLREAIQRAYKLKYTPQEVSAALYAAGNHHRIDSAEQWLRQQTHDGAPRIDSFAVDILRAPDSEYARALSKYMWVALAARILQPGCKADMALVFVTLKQGTGKSSLVRALAPFDDWFAEFDLATRDDDGSRLLKGKSVVELPELKGLASRDSESIKAWLTRQTESWVPKYKEFAVTYPRRCIFIGTDNRQRFLVDPSGNRRFLPLRVAILSQYIDWPKMKAIVGQYWAEAAKLIAAFPSVQEAVEHYSKAADRLAGPARLAATVLDEHFDEARRFLECQAPNACVTINALKAQLRMSGGYDTSRCFSILRMLGWEQIDGTNKWTRPALDANFVL